AQGPGGLRRVVGDGRGQPGVAREARGALLSSGAPVSGGPMAYTDILYEQKNGVACITINRPEVRNAFRTTTVAELTDAFLDARWDPAIGVVVLTGAGDKAFCSGGDQKERGQGGDATGAAGAASQRPMGVAELHSATRALT